MRIFSLTKIDPGPEEEQEIEEAEECGTRSINNNNTLDFIVLQLNTTIVENDAWRTLGDTTLVPQSQFLSVLQETHSQAGLAALRGVCQQREYKLLAPTDRELASEQQPDSTIEMQLCSFGGIVDMCCNINISGNLP